MKIRKFKTKSQKEERKLISDFSLLRAQNKCIKKKKIPEKIVITDLLILFLIQWKNKTDKDFSHFMKWNLKKAKDKMKTSSKKKTLQRKNK